MIETEGDEARTIMAMAVARMWKDPQYKRQFISDPKSALSREGINFGEHTLVRVVEETPAIKYVDIREQEPQETLRRLLPLPQGQEVRIVQSTDSLRYLVLPSTPAWIAPGATTGELFETAKETPASSEASVELEANVVAVISMESPMVQQSLEVETVEQVVVEVSASIEFEAVAIMTGSAEESELVANEVEVAAAAVELMTGTIA
jgi:hypothetical protein